MTPDVLEEIKNVLIATARKIECEPIEVNGEADHIPLTFHSGCTRILFVPS